MNTPEYVGEARITEVRFGSKAKAFARVRASMWLSKQLTLCRQQLEILFMMPCQLLLYGRRISGTASVTMLLVAPLPKRPPDIDSSFIFREAFVNIIQKIVSEAECPNIILERQMVSDVCEFFYIPWEQLHVEFCKQMPCGQLRERVTDKT